ncbi:NADH-quinone oxidoreductase subunit N [Candidatus Anaplasma sp. TIGMIC]|uniref:NADH-quinone oxidoreductase subunit N n=1 Tax=Candidatus Anaplasma sp. TIGMIC TaxID=3020713 RepID=UPI00232C84D4|nr:NADH-quinone oxidoreductase subunit N [Candidatus Anaplasma sp. TIGMIC]MDB1135158.1 NADH-quinone oxidoreductase subunit N [Candidatus Anaplasma sp. TIGMIC]
MYFSDLSHIVPELFVLGSALTLLILGMFMGERWVRGLATVAMGITSIISCMEFMRFTGGSVTLFRGFVSLMGHTYLSRAIVSIAGLFTFILFFCSKRDYRYEFSVMMLFAILGAMSLMISQHFLSFYLSFELIGFSTYILVCFNRSSRKATEAAIKLFILGALSSCIMLYGISLVYGYAADFEFQVFTRVLSGEECLGATLGCVLILIGVLFKLAAVPFHMWMPDTYQGAPTPAVVLFTIVTKTAIVLTITKVTSALTVQSGWFVVIMLVLASMSIVFGEFCAMRQDNIKRLLAYANVGHMGYVLAGIGGMYSTTFNPLLYYVVTYVLINVWIFSVLLAYCDEGFDISRIAGLGKKNPILAFSFVTSMLAFAGLPPFSGFFAKYTLLKAIVGIDAYSYTVLVGIVFLCITSIVPCFYCFRIARVVYFDNPIEDYREARKNRGLAVIAIISVTLSLVMILFRERFESVLSFYP